MTNTITDTRFTAINEMAANAEYYTALSTTDKSTIARILFDAGYNSRYAKRINPDYPKWQQWDCCREAAIDVFRYCKAVNGFLDNQNYYTPDRGDGWDSNYKYALQINGSLWDTEIGVEIYCPEAAIKCLLDSAILFDKAFHEAYNTSTEWTDGDKILRLAQFTNGIGKVIQRASGRKKAAKAMALYREAIRYRNAHWAIKHGG